MREFSIHPAADLFPMMSAQEFDDLVRDIRLCGQREPIRLYGGKILDGRNRCLACVKAEIKPHFRQWDGNGSLVSFIVSLNLHRRHLDESQRAMVAAKIASKRHDWGVMPTGIGISKIPTATKRTANQRAKRLRNSLLFLTSSAGTDAEAG